MKHQNLEKTARKLAPTLVSLVRDGNGKPVHNLRDYMDWFFEKTKGLELYTSPEEATIFANVLYDLSYGLELRPVPAYSVDKGEWQRVAETHEDGLDRIAYWSLDKLGRTPTIPAAHDDEVNILSRRLHEMLKTYLEKTGGELYPRTNPDPDRVLEYWKEIFSLHERSQ